MSQIKTLNGVQYTLPQFNDTGWGANTGNVLTQYIAAIADVTLQLSGGAFTLTAETDFGANFGLKALYIKSETANPASAGVLRLAKTDAIKWRNNANGADIALGIDGSDNLTYGGTKVILSGLIVNADVAAGAAIAYSKLALTGSIVNADINASAAIAYSKLALSASIVNADIASGAAIAYSKLSLTGGILNADVNASAAIALTKLAALSSHNRALASDSSGFITESAVTATELGYVSGVTSAIQTQLNATLTLPLAQNLTFDSYATHGVHGTATNNNAAAGNCGEYVESVVAGVTAPTSGQFKDLTSITLTAGDWDVTYIFALNNGAAVTEVDYGVGTVTGNDSTGLVFGSNALIIKNATNINSTGTAVASCRYSLSGGTTLYAKVSATYTSTAPTFSGRLSARRVR